MSENTKKDDDMLMLVAPGTSLVEASQQDGIVPLEPAFPFSCGDGAAQLPHL